MFYLKPMINKLSKGVLSLNDQDIDNDKKAFYELMKLGLKKEEIIREVEDYYGIKHFDLTTAEINDVMFSVFDKKTLRGMNVIPYEIDERKNIIYFAIGDTTNTEKKEKIKNSCLMSNYNAIFNFSFDFEIENKYEDMERKEKPFLERGQNIEEIVNTIIDEGIEKKASDIHIEKKEKGLQIRYRIDGVLANIKELDLKNEDISSIYVRIKILSEMDISESRKPQDGRIENYLKDMKKYDMRVSSVRTVKGEKIVIRIIEKEDIIESFEELGFNKKNEEAIKRILSHKNGIVLFGGATGSGKTTSLYAMISLLNNPETNIYSIEDPVEKEIKNVNQIEINKLAGIDYVSTLKALLRQDPDIIVVGEIRDTDTANLSIRASLTGHLVLSTIHTNNAIDCISRLLDMDIEPYLLSAGALGFMSQRLVRVLCPHCKKQKEEFTAQEKAFLERVKEEHDVEVAEVLYDPVGCPKCIGGYSGRTAINEVLEVTEEIKEGISKSLTIKEIKDIATKEGFSPMVVDGINKVNAGITTITELMKNI